MVGNKQGLLGDEQGLVGDEDPKLMIFSQSGLEEIRFREFIVSSCTSFLYASAGPHLWGVYLPPQVHCCIKSFVNRLLMWSLCVFWPMISGMKWVAIARHDPILRDREAYCLQGPF